MKKWIVILIMVCAVAPYRGDAQIIGIITTAIKKVIIAIDLQVQRLQTNTIALQNAQKAIENTMSQLHLNEITGWVQKQKDLYSEYFDELWKVKSIITYYHRIEEIAQQQTALVTEYKQAWNLLKQDKHFTVDELSYMGNVYNGILDATVQNVDQLLSVVNAFTTQMSDAKRMEIVNHVAASVSENYTDLYQFNTQNKLLSLWRAKDENDAAIIRAMYGLGSTP